MIKKLKNIKMHHALLMLLVGFLIGITIVLVVFTEII
jgi:hypothetical protein